MSYKILWTPTGKEQLLYWQRQNKDKVQKIKELVENIALNPSIGIGKPEKLKFLTNVWSRRIDKEHRLVYKVDDDVMYIIQCMYHY